MIKTPFKPGRQVFGGCDLATKIDMTSFAMVQRADPGWVCNWLFWIPEDTAEEAERRDNVPYRRWADEGYLKMTPGSRINQQFVERDIVAACYEHDISQVGFDPWNAEALITNLKNHGLWPYEVRQGFASLSEPSKHLEASVAEGSFRHGGNPIASWNAENIEIQSDVNGNIRPVKSVQSNKRIDGIVAAIIAIGVAIVTGDDEVRSVYETPGSFCP